MYLFNVLDMRIMIQLSRQRPHVRSMDAGIADQR